MDNIKNVYVKLIHPYAYRRDDEFPIVTGVYYFTPNGLPQRLCYEVRYQSDNFADMIPISEFENGNYELFSR